MPGIEDGEYTTRRLLMEDVFKNEKSCKFYSGYRTFFPLLPMLLTSVGDSVKYLIFILTEI